MWFGAKKQGLARRFVPGCAARCGQWLTNCSRTITFAGADGFVRGRFAASSPLTFPGGKTITCKCSNCLPLTFVILSFWINYYYPTPQMEAQFNCQSLP